MTSLSAPTLLALAFALALLSARPAVAGPPPAAPLDADIGEPLVHNYHHRDFGAEVQNWDVVQSDDGLVYFANNAGVLEYDSRTWRLIELPSRLDVRALVKDSRPGGRIYVGATGDFGSLEPDAVGRLQFRSLLPPEASQDKRFDQIYTPAVTPDGIVFQARDTLCRWSDERLRCQDIEPSLSRIFTVGDRNYVQKKAGLMQMVGESLRRVPGGERFTHDEITVLLPYSSGREERLLVGTRGFHLFVQHENGFVPFAEAARDPRLAGEDELLRGAVLPDGSFVLATVRRGVLIVDRDGRVVRQIDRSAGLQENHVHAVWPDRDGALWLALQNGVSRVDVSSPFSIFDERFGLEREWREVIKHRGTVYVRGYKGLYAADPPSAGTTPAGAATPSAGATALAGSGTRGAAWHFTRLPEIEPPVWAFVTVGDRLLVTSKDGVYELRDRRPRRVITYPSMPMTIYRSRSDPSRVYVGLTEGVASLRLVDGEWHDEGVLEGIDETITSMAEGPNGALWMVSQRQRIIRLEFTDHPKPHSGERAATMAARPKSAPRMRVFAFGRGALTGRVFAREVTGRPVFLTETGIFELDPTNERFIPSPSFAALTEMGRRSFCWIAEDARGDVWVASRRPGAVDILRRQFDGRYVADTASLLQMPAWSLYPEPEGGVVWLSTSDYLLRYDLSVQTRAADFSTLMRRVTVNEGTTVFGGAAAADVAPANMTSATGAVAGAAGVGAGAGLPRLSFPYRSNSLRFEFAAPRFEHAERSEFQSYLEGFDRQWSGWSKEPSRSYTNLPSGDYRFHVTARDARGVVGHEAVFAFSVLRPWYRGWAAYAAYALLVCGALVAVWKVQLTRARLGMRRQMEHLELEKLRELDRMKSRFFTDISHEFRTPLTLILGPVGQMLREIAAPDVRQRLLLVRQNAEYLLRLIAQLLDLSKVESGTLRLRAAEGDLVPVLRTIVLQFAAVAEQQGLDLDFEADDTVAVYFDREVLEKIVNNLLANACKFTPRGGSVRVSVRDLPREAVARERWKEGGAAIAVADTGIGVPRDQVPQIFNRFHQVENDRSREGIGVGLALVKELVELHGGTIAVESEEGRGTTFVVRLPKGRDHLTKDEVVDGDVGVDARRFDATRAAGLPADLAFGNAASHAGEVVAAIDAADDVVVDDQDAREARDAQDAPLSDERGSVLVVEDHVDVRRFLRDQLRPHYDVLEASHGAEGLDVAMARMPDLVLSDVMMGPMNGYELCKALKTSEKTCHIPVVLLTARAGRDDKLMGLDLGADCYIVKPFDPSELLARVRNLIDQRRRLRERFSSSVVLKPSEMAVTPMDETFLNRVLAAVEQHLSDPEFDVERLGRAVGLSRSQLHRKLRALTNQPPTLLIRSIRLQRAAELLKQEAGSVAEVAYLVGFSSQAYFAKCFREQFGCAPREYARTALRA